MYYRTFFFLLFILSSLLFFLSTFKPILILDICNSLCHYNELILDYVRLMSMSTSSITLILFVITNYYGEKKLLREKEKLATDRLNIEQIHAELEALKK